MHLGSASSLLRSFSLPSDCVTLGGSRCFRTFTSVNFIYGEQVKEWSFF